MATRSVTKKERRKQKSQWKRIVLAVAAILIVSAAIFVAPLLKGSGFGRKVVIVPENPTLEQISDTLTKYYDKGYASKVTRVAKLMGGAFRLRAGAFEIPKNASAFEAARKIGRGSRYIVTVSLNNIRTPEELAKKVSAQLRIDEDELLREMRNERTLKDYGLNRNNFMALFIADSYEMYWETDAKEFMKKTGENYKRFWNEERREKASKLGLTPAEVATIASIADEESNKADEKGRICRLYYNRLKKRMRLQADPTVKYAAGDFNIKRITGKHLGIDSPYNTYRNGGLPPGPIRISDKRSIDAFLDSEETSDIYMCAKEDFSGYHNFTSSYNEHLTNARRYQEKLNASGIN